MPGIAPDSTAWIRRKRNVVARFHKSSLLSTMLERYSRSSDDYCASGGAVHGMSLMCMLYSADGMPAPTTVSTSLQMDSIC